MKGIAHLVQDVNLIILISLPLINTHLIMKVSQSIIFRRNERYVKYNKTYCRDTTATNSGTNSTSCKWQPASAVHVSYKSGSVGMASDNATAVGKSNKKSKLRRKKKIRR